jgi:hypothetical protein
MNKTLVIGVVVAVSLLMLIQFPDDTTTLIENFFAVVGDIWDALRGLIREFV